MGFEEAMDAISRGIEVLGIEAPYLWRDPRSIGDGLVGTVPSLTAGHGGLSRVKTERPQRGEDERS